ncbi:MAG: radical SAM protein [Chloroflexi bacterium]|nr:radical SAM protein [Chloroflexota bacterium]
MYKDQPIEPGYVSLYKSGELERRAEMLELRLASCDICPKLCRVDRTKNQVGFCQSGYLPVVSSVCAHHGEEPVLSGTRGSGTIFFGNCNMRCVYCQNHQISQDTKAQAANQVSFYNLAEKMLYLQGLGCHNVNLVSPSHFVPQILRALVYAVPMGLRLPLVYNTGGYDAVSVIKALDGVISIYLPDLRYASEQWARRYSKAPGYVASSRDAVKEMFRQVGELAVDSDGIARKGLVVRHLILPNGLAGSAEALTWLAREVSPKVTVSIMSQYYPANKAREFPLLARKITLQEFREVARLIDKLGLENGWVQELDAAEYYRPDFSREGHPFSNN